MQRLEWINLLKIHHTGAPCALWGLQFLGSASNFVVCRKTLKITQRKSALCTIFLSSFALSLSVFFDLLCAVFSFCDQLKRRHRLCAALDFRCLPYIFFCREREINIDLINFYFMIQKLIYLHSFHVWAKEAITGGRRVSEQQWQAP